MDMMLIRNATILTMNPARDIIVGDILIQGDTITEIGKLDLRLNSEIDATGMVAMPGFIQTHVHLCQTLFRNLADDMQLKEWLRTRIWPLEAAHDEDSISLSALLGIAELFKCGTTTILDMATVHLTEFIFSVAQATGIRAIIGKVMMDSGSRAPKELIETPEEAIRESLMLFAEWHNIENGRLQAAFAPRFIPSCSDEMLYEIKALSRERNVLIHTHAAETRHEIQYTQRKAGSGNIEYLCHLGLTGPRLCLAHCIWVTRDEIDILQRTDTRVLHCPSANLKLASGIAPVPEMLNKGILVSLGSDGAPCNNNLDIFQEMRLAALIQKYRLRNASALPAYKLVAMATIDAARSLGMENQIGSIETGKKADIILLDLNRIHNLPADNIYSQLVYSAKSEDVKTVIVDGKTVMRNRELLTISEDEIVRSCKRETQRILQKI
ncbi:5'-deoxyadenosine deaminase [candidate division KSB1 bacterium]|nr:5'-deoxyadenosine deaminase [candidate division KSB1 bacterium]